MQQRSAASAAAAEMRKALVETLSQSEAPNSRRGHASPSLRDLHTRSPRLRRLLLQPRQKVQHTAVLVRSERSALDGGTRLEPRVLRQPRTRLSSQVIVLMMRRAELRRTRASEPC